MHRRYRFALRPTPAQVALLETAVEACAEAFNLTVTAHRQAARTGRSAPPRTGLQSLVVSGVRADPRYAAVSAVALQQAVGEADRLCRRAQDGKAVWPGRRDTSRRGSIHFTLAAARGFTLSGQGRDGQVVVPTVGPVRAILHRPLPAAPSSMTVGRDRTGWWVSFIVDVPEPEPLSEGAIVGIDLGVRHLASWIRIEPDGSTSRGRIANRRLGGAAKKRIERLERLLVEAKPGSRRARDADRRLGQAMMRLHRQRVDYARKEAAVLLDGVRAVAVEDLNLRSLHRTGDCSTSALSDAAIGVFVRALEDRARVIGVEVTKVNPARTSMTCPICDRVRKKRLRIGTKRWRCADASCRTWLDRDWAAAVVIARHAGLVAPGAGETSNALAALVAPEEA